MISRMIQITRRRLKTTFIAPFFKHPFNIEQVMKKIAQIMVKTISTIKGEYIIAAPVATACKPKKCVYHYLNFLRFILNYLCHIKKLYYISKTSIRNDFFFLLDFIFSIGRCDCDLLLTLKRYFTSDDFINNVVDNIGDEYNK